MNEKREERFVLLIDHDCTHVRRTAVDLAGDDGYVLIARSFGAAIEFAKRYHPSHAVIAQSRVTLDGNALPQLLAEFSPETEIVVVRQRELGQSEIAKGQNA